MRYYKMNDFQAHLSDNYIWLGEYGKNGTENNAFSAYEAFRLESGLTNEAGEVLLRKITRLQKNSSRNLSQTNAR